MKKKLLLMTGVFLLVSMISFAQNAIGDYVSSVSYSLYDNITNSGTFLKSGYKNKPEWVHITPTGEFHVVKQTNIEYGSIVLHDPVQNLDYLIDFEKKFLKNATSNEWISTKLNIINGLDLPIEDQAYHIVALSSGKYISLPPNNQDNGIVATQNREEYNPNQLFKINYAGNGKYNFLTVLSDGKKALDLNGGNSADGTYIIQWDYKNSASQQFILWPIDYSSYGIKTMHNKFFGIDGGIANTKDGALIHQMPYTGTKEQQFRLDLHVESTPGYRLDGGN